MSTFANRRKARKVGQDENSWGNDTPDSEPAVKRPASSTSKPKQKSKLRLSFGPGETSMNDGGDANDDSSPVVTPKRLGLGRKAIEKSALSRASALSSAATIAPIRPPGTQDDDRPNYNKDYLNELRNSTPSTPKDLRSAQVSDDDVEMVQKSLDIAAKFGELATIPDHSIIPSEAEIREKKERRARLAKEQDFISLDDVPEYAGNNYDDDDVDDDDDEFRQNRNEISLRPKKEKPETRLVRDDEDFAEGFDNFVEDGRISLGKKAEREQKRRHRAEMKELIEEAEDSEEADDSEGERRTAYEVAQTRAGMDGLQRKSESQKSKRPRTPPRISALPRLGGVLEKLQSSLSRIQYEQMQLQKKIADLKTEEADIAVREVEIQSSLKEAGEKYEVLKAEAGAGLPAIGNGMQNGRGLESLGPSTPEGVGSGARSGAE